MAPTPPEPSIDSQSRTWGMLAHLCVLVNLFVPLGGLIASLLIYALRTDDAIARENERNALNFEITLVALAGVGTVVYLLAFYAFVVMAPSHSGVAASRLVALLLGSIVAVVLVSIASTIMGGLGARAAWLGRVFRYPIAIDFIR